MQVHKCPSWQARGCSWQHELQQATRQPTGATTPENMNDGNHAARTTEAVKGIDGTEAVPDPTAAADLGLEALVAGDDTADRRHGEISTQSTKIGSKAESDAMKAVAAAGTSLTANLRCWWTDSITRSHSRRPNH